MQPFIQFESVSKAFGPLTVVDNLDLGIAKGEFLSLLGPSGSGKTTILMMLAGFERPTSGTIHLGGKRIDHLPPHRRQMGVVFQNYALFPHMTVAENVAFPLRMQRLPRAEIDRRVERALDMVRLGALKDRRPSQLSGGQQQRVALTRALVFEPDVILMDEPLGALDKQLREHMQIEIRDLHRRLGLTIVFVTHDQTEALTMSDRIGVFNAGRIEQLDAPHAVYDTPRSRFVAQFIGETNLMEGRVAALEDATATVIVEGLPLRVRRTDGLALGQEVSLSLRPERIRLGADSVGGNLLPVTISDCVYHGDHMRVQLASGPLGLVARCERLAGDWAVGTPVTAGFDPADLTVLAR
ncbi:ABC transporter ATP-binding protein [Azospirillum sp. SYSU D00513]|uniref:ABC transporter ATP-binding protein n=1 Tax=Azospirillum sp. SYSU D00513 TaxID=2812561 RepID=UPI001A97BA9F|nr:ABC transporter ATP-binding protein [Azospirillum sp. SYSU D00513]